MAVRGHHKVEPGFNLSSMTDLVFLLLIFFVIVSTMISPYALPVDLPKGSKMTMNDRPKVILRIEEDGAYLLNGRPVMQEELERSLTAEMAKHEERDAIVLRVAPGVPTGKMVEMLDMAQDHDWRIVLAASSSPIPIANTGTQNAVDPKKPASN